MLLDGGLGIESTADAGLIAHLSRQAEGRPDPGRRAARRMGISQPKVSGLLRGDFANLSERKLMDCLNRLGYDSEIKASPGAAAVGHLTLAVIGGSTSTPTKRSAARV